jgi:hypothetical protein
LFGSEAIERILFVDQEYTMAATSRHEQFEMELYPCTRWRLYFLELIVK